MLKKCMSIWFVNVFTHLFSWNENIFVRNESEHSTGQALNENLHVPYIHSTQTMYRQTS